MTRSRLGASFLHLGAAVVVLALLGWAFHDVPRQRVIDLLSRVGLAGAISSMVPQGISFALETLGWRRAFSLMGARVEFLPLLRVRVATESLASLLPAGVVFSESAKLPLLVQHCRLGVASAAAGIAARKYLLLSSQALYLSLAGALAYTAFSLVSTRIVTRSGLEMLLFAASAALALGAVSVRVLLSRGRVATRLRDAMLRSPFEPVRRFIQKSEVHFKETDGRLARLFQAPPRAEAVATLWCFLGWAFESVETYWILRLLGVTLDFTSVAGFESALSLLRSLVFVLPAGLGVQDAGYALFLAALGVPEAGATAGAFVLLKRGKELAFAALGLALLGGDLHLLRSAPPGRVAPSQAA